MKFRPVPYLLALLAFFSFSSFSPSEVKGPDLIVRVVQDNLAKEKKCKLAVLKDGSFKSMDDKYKILSYDMYILNYRGKKKWHAELEKADVDLSTEEEVEIVPGDLIVIDNIILIHIRSGNTVEVNKVTERYLVR